MKHITIEDVARYSNVSIATVNRMIRSSGYVSKEKREQIEAAIAALGYVSRSNARRTVLPEAKLIAHFTRGNTHPLFSRLSEGISRVANKYGYFVITLHVEDSSTARDIAKTIDTLLPYNIQGIILNSLADVIDFLPIHKYLQSLPVPLVMVERTADIYNVNKVLINAREALFLAVRHLKGKGHRNIVFFNTQTNASVEKSRIEGFYMAAESFGIRDSVTYIPTPNYNSDDGYEAIGRYLESSPLPGAIIAADSLLVGMLQYFYQRGIHVPQDVSMIGLDDTFSLYTSPKLTTIAFPEKQMSETAIDLILKQGPQDKEMSTAREILLSPYLIERDSVLEAR